MTVAAAGSLSSRLVDLCDRIGDSALAPVRARLADPSVRVAVVGRLNAGKSTLVNALLRHPAAPVAAGECTRVTTWFSYGAHENATVELLDGSTRDVALGMERRLPSDLPVDHAEARRLVVRLSNDTLRSMTLIDTPGMDTTTPGLAERSRDVLGIGDEHVSGEADAVIYVMPHARASDVERLDRLRAVLGTGAGPLATIGVLTKTDRLSGEDPLATGAAMAVDLARELRGVLTTVLPVVGLWAETADADGLTESDARVLRTVAELDPRTRLLGVSSPKRFTELAVPGASQAQLERLVSRLDMTGVRALIDDEVGGASAVSARLREWSGITDLRQTLDALLADRADVLRAHSALVALRDIAWSAALSTVQREQLLDGIDAVETAPEYHPWHEARALADFTDGTGTGDAGLDQEAIRVLTATAWYDRLGIAETSEPASALDAALTCYRRWTEIVNSPQTQLAARRASEVVRRSYLLCYRELAGQ